ncbi:toll-like receptor 13 [Latimeria chalumnae]|uniref:toll-like receptor 13 n=1 Tax=Latimeria chalumnae TaxID=7897 RepID=UPI00313E72C4
MDASHLCSFRIFSLTFATLMATSCYSYTFRDCGMSGPQQLCAWCLHKGIVNVSYAVEDIPAKTNSFILSQNKIRQLPAGAFSRLHHVSNLKLDQNHIVEIQGGVFVGLEQLWSLNLSFNHIQEILNGTFQGLDNLQVLFLSHNRISIVSSGAIAALGKLEELHLSDNRIPSAKNITSGILTHLRKTPRLHTLVLSGAPVELLDGSELSQLNKLQVTYPEKQNFTWFCGLLKSMPRLVLLHMSNVALSNITHISQCTNLFTLFLADGNFGSIADNMLMRIPNLEYLQLFGCKIIDVSNLTWKGFPHLKVLHIKISLRLFLKEYAFSTLKDLFELQLQNCDLQTIDSSWFYGLSNLKLLYLDKNQLTVLNPRSFRYLQSLEHLNIRQNALRAIYVHDFSNLTSLLHLELSSNNIQHIDNYAFQTLSTKEGPTSPFNTLPSLSLLELRYQGESEKGLGDLSQDFFKGLSNLQSLSIGYTGETFFHPDIFAPLQKLRTLFIANMHLSLSNLSALFWNLTHLEKLSLVRIDVESLPVDMFRKPNQLRFLRLTGNQQLSLSQQFFSNLNSLKGLDMHTSTFTCSCINSWLWNWSINNQQVQVIDFCHYQCTDHMGLFVKFDFSLCIIDISMYFFIHMSILDLLMILIPLIYTRFSPHIRFFWHKSRARIMGYKRVKLAQLYKYDAFVSYSCLDEDWVMKELYPQLEQQGPQKFRLCLHHRDFELGRDILDNIEKAIHQSRKTLCVISKSYLQSDWCALEIQLASIRLLFDHSDVLILIFLEHIPDYRLSSYYRLCKLVKKTFIQWPEKEEEQELFWMRLKEALRPESVAPEEPKLIDIF